MQNIFFTHSISEMIKISAQHATETLTVSGFLISFSDKHVLCTYVQASCIAVRAANYDRRIHKHQQTKARKDRRAYVHAYSWLCSEEVHTETTMNTRITSNPQRTQKTKVTSSYDSRNNILIFPSSLSELSISCRPKRRLLVWVQPATLLNSFFILQKVWINKLRLIVWPLAFRTMKTWWRRKEMCPPVCISHVCTCPIWMCVCV